MRAYVIRRCLQSIIVINIVLVIVFLMLHMSGSPGDVLMPEDSSLEDIEEFNKAHGFDQPLHVQYYRFIFGFDNGVVKSKGVIFGDFGYSYRHELPAHELVFEHFPATIDLALTAVVISILVAIPAGVLSATFRNSWIDYVSSIGSMFGQSMPNFWLGLMLIIFFSVYLDLFPSSGYESPRYIVLPALTAGLYQTARITRVVRAGMLEVLGSEYITTARSKGIVEWIVIMRHALKNAAIPVVTLIGLELGVLLGGTVVTEVIFAWPGVGFLVIDAINNQDYPIVQAAVTLLATIFVFINLLVDLIYAWLDPRIAYS